MSLPGGHDLLVIARRVLLDALDALAEHRDALVLIGAQAVYLHAHTAAVALPEATKDSDLAVDRRRLADDPLLEEAMTVAGFEPGKDPGAWIGDLGVPVDLMVPATMTNPGGRRGARVPPHSKRAMRAATGLEAAMVDNAPMDIASLDPADERSHTIKVAGPAALIVAKMHKLGDRDSSAPTRLVDKDAHDVYRLLVATPTEAVAAPIKRLLASDLAAPATRRAMSILEEMFSTADAIGARMAGRAEDLVGDPAFVSEATAALAGDLLTEVGRVR